MPLENNIMVVFAVASMIVVLFIFGVTSFEMTLILELFLLVGIVATTGLAVLDALDASEGNAAVEDASAERQAGEGGDEGGA